MIETERLWLTPPKLSEVPALYRFLGDPKSMQFTQCDASLRACRRRVAVHEWRRRHDGYAPWTVRRKDTGEIIGWGGLYHDPFDHGWGLELAYFFDRSAWGQGLARELCTTALNILDRDPNPPKVAAFSHPENATSIALLEKLGFERVRFVPELNRDFYSRTQRAD
ncbi:MAG: GNAT family N-acetyltransferase [Pseudomonadota bacterium]